MILPTSMNGDRTQTGYDLEFTRAIADAVTLPVVASGGTGTLEHFYEVAVRGKAEILPAASIFHFRLLSIRGVKEYLRDQGIGGQPLVMQDLSLLQPWGRRKTFSAFSRIVSGNPCARLIRTSLSSEFLVFHI